MCQHQSTMQATVKDGDDTVNIQQLTDQYSTLDDSELSSLTSKWQLTISQVSISTMVFVFN